MTSDGQPFFRAKYKNIIQEQTMIGYLSKGGVTYGDTEIMSPYERKIALEFLQEIIEKQNEATKNAINNSKSGNGNSNIKDPKTRATSGMAPVNF